MIESQAELPFQHSDSIINAKPRTQQLVGSTIDEERLQKSHGGDNRLSGFYTTSYDSTFCPDKTYSPVFRTKGHTSSGWTKDVVPQPFKQDPWIRREISNGKVNSPTNATTYSAGYQFAYKFWCDNINNMVPVARSSFPDLEQEKQLLRQEKVPIKPVKSEYKSEIATFPAKQWMTTERLMSVDYHKDHQSPYIRQTPFANFLSPESVNMSIKNKTENKTDYMTNFNDPIQATRITDNTESINKTRPFELLKPTQYDGFKNRLWDRQTAPQDPADRWTTQTRATYNWKNWKDTEDVRGVRRPFGPPPTAPSGFTENESFLNVNKQTNHHEKGRSLPFTTLE